MCAWTGVAHADVLRAEVLKHSFFPYEPVPIHVDLHFDDPVVVNFAANPEEAERQLRRIPRRLNIKLLDPRQA